jgi:hypothetical protein
VARRGWDLAAGPGMAVSFIFTCHIIGALLSVLRRDFIMVITDGYALILGLSGGYWRFAGGICILSGQCTSC